MASPVALALTPRDTPRGARRPLARRAATLLAPLSSPRRIGAVCAALVCVEVAGSLLMWAPLPLIWMWIGGRVFAATGSLGADLTVALAGFLATTIVTMKALARLDEAWVDLRRRAGHDQAHGALTAVVVVSATLGLAGFLVWYYALSKAFIIPFMPTR